MITIPINGDQWKAVNEGGDTITLQSSKRLRNKLQLYLNQRREFTALLIYNQHVARIRRVRFAEDDGKLVTLTLEGKHGA